MKRKGILVRRRRFVSVGSVVLAAAAVLAGAGPPSAWGARGRSSARLVREAHISHGSVTYGVDVNQFDGNIGPQKLGQVLSLVASSGAGNVRFGPGGGWQAIEASGPSDNWAGFDANLASAYADHLSVLLEMGNEPAWDAAGGNVNAPPSDCYGWSSSSPSTWCSSVSSWVKDLVTHLASTTLSGSSPPVAEITDVAGLIPRNEPQNYAMNWVDPASGGPAQWALDYAHFQETVYQAAHSALTSFNQQSGSAFTIAVMNGGEELAAPQNRVYSRPFENGASSYSQNADTMLETLFSTPAFCESVDTFDIHVGDHGPLWSVKMVDDTEAALENCDGGRSLPIWVSEVAYTSIPQVQSLPEYAAELGGAYQGGQLGQARYLYDTVTALRMDSNVVGINWTFAVDPNTTGVSTGGQLHTLHNSGPGLGFDASNPDSFYVSKVAFAAFEAAVQQGGGSVPPPPLPPASPSPLAVIPTLLDSVSCNASNTCVAVGSPGAVATSSDGGSTWEVQPGIPGVGALYGVSCTSSMHCVAVGYGASGAAIETTQDGGSTWSAVTVPNGVTALDGVSCWSSTCAAVGETMSGAAIVFSNDSGSTWSSASMSSPVTDLAGISCSSPAICTAVGDGIGTSTAVALASSDGGRTWTAQTLPPGGQFLSSVSCPDPSSCLAVGAGSNGAPWAVQTSDGGSTWNTLTLSGAASALYSISCASPSSCIATGDASSASGFLTTSDGGQSWSAVPSSGMSAAMGVNCTGSVCVAVGSGTSSVNVSTDGGSTWKATGPDTEVQQYLGTSCPTSSTCVTVGDTTTGGFASATSDGGQSWTSPVTVAGAADLFSISCPDSTTCYAGGDTSATAAVYVSTDLGMTWKAASSSPPNLVAVTGIYCTSASDCIAVGDDTSGSTLVGGAASTTDGGATWTPSQVPNNVFDLSGVSCASASSCVAVGDGGSTSSTAATALFTGDGGATWSSGAIPSGPSTFYAVSCVPGLSFCMAGGEAFGGGAEVATSADGGATWTLAGAEPAMSAVLSITCTGSGNCWAAGAGDDPVALTSGGGASWSPVPGPAGTSNLAAIACPEPGTCIATGGATALQVSASTPSPPPPPSSTTTTSPPSSTTTTSPPSSTTTTTQPSPPSHQPGYWMLDAAGQVFPFGSAQSFGSASSGGNWVAMAGSPGGGGYLLISSTGQIDDLGDAGSYQVSSETYGVSKPVSIASTPDGRGYWVASANGQVLTAGDAGYFGSPAQSGLKLNAAIVNMAPTPDGRGYWLLGGDGGVFTYGDAAFYGSTGNIKLVAPAVAMASTADGHGYWFVAGDGGVFTFGDAGFFGSMGGKPLNKPVDGIVATPDGLGYWLVASDGGVFTFGDASFVGSLGGNPPTSPVVAFSPS